MAYEVIKDFVDLQDDRFQYRAGDIFPRSGVSVTIGRLRELSGNENASGTPLIREVANHDVDRGVPKPKKLVRKRKVGR